MSYESRRSMAGQEVVKKFTFCVRQCKYTQTSYATINKASIKSPAFYDPGYTGSILTSNIQVGLFDVWGYGVEVYARLVNGGTEIFKLAISGIGTFSIIERGVLGSIQETLFGQFKLYHLGELDGSCYGYAQTCSNSDSFQVGLFKNITFASAPLPAGTIYHGGLDFKALNYTSAEIKPGETMGSRSSVSGAISDQQNDDSYLAYYPNQRTSYGTLFGKLLARNPFFGGVPCIYSIGLRDAGTLDEPEWEDRRLIIDKVNLSNDRFTFSALDPLILTEGKKAKMPITSPAQLSVAVTGASTSITFGNAPAGYFGASGNIIVRIESELIQVTANGTLTMPIVGRGFGNTEIKDHDINSTVQNCLRFVDEHVIDCITYAISTWTDAAEFLDDYSDTKALMPTYIISDYVLSSPTDVVDFVNKLIFLGNLIFYFDDVTQKIVIKYILEESLELIFLDEQNHIRKGSVKRDLNHKEFYTRFGMSWAPFNLTKETDDKNQQISLLVANIDLESPENMGEINERKSVIFPLLTNSTDDYLLGASTVSRIARVEQAPEIFECELDAETMGPTQGGALELGSVVEINSSECQSKTGQAEARLYQLVKFSGDAFEHYRAKFRRYQRLEPTEYDFVIDPGIYVAYDLSAHFAPAAGNYTIYIKPNVSFGSIDTAIPAFTTGAQAVGVSFKIIMRGKMLGMGGNGGDSGLYPVFTNPTAGLVGGDAFNATVPCDIDCGSGLIWAGGGGAGGWSQATTPWGSVTLENPTSGGGGGQGFGDSVGGLSTYGGSDETSGSHSIHDHNAEGGNQGGPGYPGGGEWGESGTTYQAIGGLAGYAIKKNGNIVNITAGDNPLSIRGRRA